MSHSIRDYLGRPTRDFDNLRCVTLGLDIRSRELRSGWDVEVGRLPEALKKKTINRTHSVPRLFIDAPVYIPRAMPFSRRARHVGGFTRWKDYDSYQKTFDRMQRDPRAGA